MMATSSIFWFSQRQSGVVTFPALLIPKINHVRDSKVTMDGRTMTGGIDGESYPPLPLGRIDLFSWLPCLRTGKHSHAAPNVFAPLQMTLPASKSTMTGKLMANAAFNAKALIFREHCDSALISLGLHLRLGKADLTGDPIGAEMRPPFGYEGNAFWIPRLSVKDLLHNCYCKAFLTARAILRDVLARLADRLQLPKPAPCEKKACHV